MASKKSSNVSTTPKERATRRSKTDQDRRRAALVATWVAIPVTLAAAVGAYAIIRSVAPNDGRSSATPTPSGTVTVSAPELSDSNSEVCRALVSVLPNSLDDQPRRKVTGNKGTAELAAAWGDPAIALHCGVSEIKVKDEADVYKLGKTCWYAKKAKGSTVWTTLDRSLPVEVTVPKKYEQPGQLVQAVTKSVAKKVPANKDAPSGCS